MDAKKSKITTIIAAVIGVLGIIFFLRVILAGDDSEALDGSVGMYVGFATIALYIIAGVTVVLSLLNLVKNPQALKKALIGVVALVVLLGIMYVMAPDNAVTGAGGKILEGGEAGSTSKWVSALINFTGVLGVIGLITIALGFVKSLK